MKRAVRGAIIERLADFSPGEQMKRALAATNTAVVVGVVIGLVVGVGVITVTRLDTFGGKGSGLGAGFRYDVGELAKIDPNLILYRESSEPIDTGLSHSRALAVDSRGALYVGGDRAVRVFWRDGSLLGEIATGGEPTALTVAQDGKVYVCVQDHVEVYDAGGRKLASWESLGGRAVLTSIAVSGDEVFVADAGDRVVVRYDSSGRVVGRIGRKDAERNIPGFVVPSPYFDLAVAKDGLLRVANPGRRRIEAYTKEGDFEFAWGRSSVEIDGFCGCCNPVNFAVLPEGGFVTVEKGLVRVKVYDSQGRFVGVVAGPAQLVEEGSAGVCELPEQCRAGGFDIAVDSEGRVFVLDTIKNVVRTFSKKEGGK